MDATLADTLVGHLLDGRYRVDSRIARGGMATVYAATDTRLDRRVALKIMHKELASDADFVRRFIDEARSVARLSHPNVVAVFDQGSDGEHLYLAMECVPGRTMRDLLNQRGRLPPAEALDLAVPVLAGLGAAHQAGLVHRDVKPENVLLTTDGRVKVADFGLARAVAQARQTRTGMIIGTAAYLAPEQVSRAVADARSDVYAAGVMLFELVTGRPPYTGGTPLAVAHRHVSETVPAPSHAVAGLPPAVDALVALATSRDPELRPADAGQLLSAVLDARRRLPGGSAFAPGPGVPFPGPQGWPPVRPAAEAHGQQPPPQQQAAPVQGSSGPPPQHSAILGVPGVPGVPALPAFGTGGGPVTADHGEQGRGQRTAFLSEAGGQNHTLVVSGGPGGHGTHARRRLALGDVLFSRRTAYLAAGLAVVLIAGLIVWWQAAGRYTRVPDVSGLTPATATAELRNLGFSVKLAAPQVNNQVPKGDVAGTLPAIGHRAAHGATITVIPSAGPRMISVPNVTGQQLADARKALAAAGLAPGAVQQETSPTVPKGEVISTNPAPGTSWPQTKPVEITESAGIGLPDFTGQPKQAAEQWLQAHQLQFQEQPVASTTQAQDSVVKQSPAANTAITTGEVVILDVSTGPPMAQIPSVTGMPAHQASQQLRALGFQVNVVGFQGGRVIAYSPTGQAPKGSTVTIIAGPGGLP